MFFYSRGGKWQKAVEILRQGGGLSNDGALRKDLGQSSSFAFNAALVACAKVLHRVIDLACCSLSLCFVVGCVGPTVECERWPPREMVSQSVTLFLSVIVDRKRQKHLEKCGTVAMIWKLDRVVLYIYSINVAHLSIETNVGRFCQLQVSYHEYLQVSSTVRALFILEIAPHVTHVSYFLYIPSFSRDRDGSHDAPLVEV